MGRKRNRGHSQPVAKVGGVKTSAPVSVPREVKITPRSNNWANTSAVQRKAPVVNPDTAEKIATVWSCWNVLSQDISTLPLNLMRRVGDKTEVVHDHPAARVIAAPNPLMTSAEWRSYGIVRLLAHGNWIDQSIRDNKSGELLQIWPLCNEKAGLLFDEAGDPWWSYKTDKVAGGVAYLPYAEVLHIRGMSTDGWLGLSPIAAQKKLLGWEVSAEDFGLAFFVNGATASGVVKFPADAPMSDEAYARFKKDFEEQHAGMANAHKPMILEGGADFSAISINNDSAQFLETLKFLRSITGGIYRVPAHMVNDLERSTFSNIEEQGIMYVSHAVSPWCVVIEQRLNMTLLTAQERAAGYYFKHNLRGLMRGKFSEQMSSFQTGLQNGVYNPNEVRDLLDMNGYVGGEVYTRNTASAPVSAQSNQQPQQQGGTQQ